MTLAEFVMQLVAIIAKKTSINFSYELQHNQDIELNCDESLKPIVRHNLCSFIELAFHGHDNFYSNRGTHISYTFKFLAFTSRPQAMPEILENFEQMVHHVLVDNSEALRKPIAIPRLTSKVFEGNTIFQLGTDLLYYGLLPFLSAQDRASLARTGHSLKTKIYPYCYNFHLCIGSSDLYSDPNLHIDFESIASKLSTTSLQQLMSLYLTPALAIQSLTDFYKVALVSVYLHPKALKNAFFTTNDELCKIASATYMGDDHAPFLRLRDSVAFQRESIISVTILPSLEEKPHTYFNPAPLALEYKEEQEEPVELANGREHEFVYYALPEFCKPSQPIAFDAMAQLINHQIAKKTPVFFVHPDLVKNYNFIVGIRLPTQTVLRNATIINGTIKTREVFTLQPNDIHFYAMAGKFPLWFFNKDVDTQEFYNRMVRPSESRGPGDYFPVVWIYQQFHPTVRTRFYDALTQVNLTKQEHLKIKAGNVLKAMFEGTCATPEQFNAQNKAFKPSANWLIAACCCGGVTGVLIAIAILCPPLATVELGWAVSAMVIGTIGFFIKSRPSLSQRTITSALESAWTAQSNIVINTPKVC